MLLFYKKARLSLLLILIMQASFYSVVRKTNGQANNEQAQASLELTTSIVNQRYCKSSDAAGYNTLRMELQLRYKNIGHQPVILYKGSSVGYREMISLSAQDVARKTYLFDGTLTVDVEGEPEIATGAAPDKNFVVLLPGTSFETMAKEGGVLFLKVTTKALMTH